MKFLRDLLFVNVQTTGPDPERDYIIQLTGLVLNKENLLEKARYSSLVRVSLLDSVIGKHAQLLEVDVKTLRQSPKPLEVLREFYQLGTDVFLATHTPESILFLRALFKKQQLTYPYPVHVVDCWTLSYVYCLSLGLKKVPTTHTMLEYFNIRPQGTVSPLERIRLEAEIFKRVVNAA